MERKIVGMDGKPTGAAIVDPEGNELLMPKKADAVGEFIVCHAKGSEKRTAGGLWVTLGNGTYANYEYIVASIGPAVELKKADGTPLAVGDMIIPIAPEAIPIVGSDHMWAFFHQDQVKAVIVDA